MSDSKTEVLNQSLEDRLNNLNNTVRERLVAKLLKPMIRPRDVIGNRRYLKDDLSPYIVQRIQEDGVNFGNVGGAHAFQETLYSSINKEPMKRTYWGQFNANPPAEVMGELTPWAVFYFYAGVWAKKSTRLPHRRFSERNLRSQNIYKIVYDCVIEGIRVIETIHNKLFRQGTYKNLLEAPHKRDVLAIMQQPRHSHYSRQLPLL